MNMTTSKTTRTQGLKPGARAATAAMLCLCLLFATSCFKKKQGPGTVHAPVLATGAPTLEFVRAWGTDVTGGANLSGPAALVRLDDGGLLVLDRFNRRIQHYGPAGRYIGTWGQAPGGGPFPFTVLVDMVRDPATGNIIVAVNHRLTKESLDRSCGGVFYADTLLAFSQDGLFTGDPKLVKQLEESTAALPAYQRRLNDDFWKRNEEMFCLSTFGRIAVNTDALPQGAVEVIDGPIRIVRPGKQAQAVEFPSRPDTSATFCEAQASEDGWLYLVGCLLRREVYRTRLDDLRAGRLYLDVYLQPPDKRTVSATTDTRHNLFTFLPQGGFAVYDVRANHILRYDNRGNPTEPVKIAPRIYFAQDLLPEPDGGFLIADYVADSVVRVGPDGKFGGRIGTNRSAPGQFAGHSFAIFRGGAQQGNAVRPAGIVGVAADTGGNVFASDAHNRRVQMFDPKGRFLDAIYLCGNTTDCFPADVIAANGAIYVTLFGQHTIIKLNPGTGQELARWRVPKPDALAECSLCGAGVDPAGNIFVSDGLHVYKLDADLRPDPDWNRDTLSVPPLQYPLDITFDARGRLFLTGTNVPPLMAVTDSTSAVCRFTSGFEFETCFNWQDLLFHPRGAAIVGNTLLVASSARDSIIQSDLDGTVIQVWGGPGREPGKFQNPLGITADPDGNVFIADNGNERVQQFKLAAPQ
jgi:hypothetical protein